MEIRQNLSNEVAWEPFHNFPCAGLPAREDSGQGREEENADCDRGGKICLKKPKPHTCKGETYEMGCEKLVLLYFFWTSFPSLSW